MHVTNKGMLSADLDSEIKCFLFAAQDKSCSTRNRQQIIFDMNVDAPRGFRKSRPSGVKQK